MKTNEGKNLVDLLLERGFSINHFMGIVRDKRGRRWFLNYEDSKLWNGEERKPPKRSTHCQDKTGYW